MNVLRKAVTTLGGIFLGGILIAALAPKATRGVAAALVQVVNTPSNPVATAESLGAANIVQVLCEVASGAGGGPTDSGICYTVPAGKRLIIENLDGSCLTQAGFTVTEEILNDLSFSTGNTFDHRIPLHFAGADIFNHQIYDFDFPVRLYAGPGDEFIVTMATNEPNQMSGCRLFVTGRLLPTS